MPTGESRPSTTGRKTRSPEIAAGPVVGAAPSSEEHAAHATRSAQTRAPARPTRLGVDRGRLENDSLAPVRKRRRRVVGVDLAREPVTVVGGLRDDARRDTVPDPVERRDP